MNYIDDQSTLKPKKIQIKIYKAVENEFQLELQKNKTLQVGESFENLYNEYKSNNSLYTDSVIKTLKSIWSAVTSGGKLIKELERNTINLDLNYTTPVETADSKFYLKDLKIKFKEYGKYQLVFIVDGVESPLSEIIEVSQGLNTDNVTSREVFLLLLHILFVLFQVFKLYNNYFDWYDHFACCYG